MRIRSIVMSRIADGTYTVGDRFPLQKQLAEEFGVAESIVRVALQPLNDNKAIVRVGAPWQGFRVDPSAVSRLDLHGDP
ncbi:GntR family transcriptional regulator [Streptomyces sp. NPDC026672]|uniref:GntR family transcriptional regulator n=1 Tax=unclassified Streptomyces TaxID=2593676 RepID=UPI0033F63B67